jgi:hypothetical protein
MFDQVLIRPSLLDAFAIEEMHIATTDGTVEFCRKDGRPDRTLASDHLPLLFTLKA